MPKSHDSSGPEIQERDWFSEFAPTRFADEVGAGNLGTSILLATPTKSECQDSLIEEAEGHRPSLDKGGVIRPIKRLSLSGIVGRRTSA